MKNVKALYVLIIIAAIAVGTSLGSCKKDTTSNNNNNNATIKYCDTVHCHGAAICDSATRSCQCPASTGYEGADCSTESRAKFLGSYVVTETCTIGTDNYTIAISANSANVMLVNIGNFYDLGYTAVGSVSGTTLTIPSQTVGTNVTASGTGTISADGHTLTVTYTITNTSTSNTNTCTFTGTKQ